MLDWKEEIRQRLGPLRLAPTREAEIVEELTQHLEDRYEELLSEGATVEAAFQAALEELSESGLLIRELRHVEHAVTSEPVVLGGKRTGHTILDLGQDIRYSIRSLLKHPGFTAVAVITLALGIGATTAIFSVVNAVLLRPLPFKNADRLIWVSETNPNQGVHDMSVSPPTFLDWRAQQQSFDELAALSEEAVILTGDGEPERMRAAAVSSNYLSMLTTPSEGRFFAQDDDRVGSQPVVVLSHQLWRTRFNGDTNLVGKSITLDGKNYEVVGIAPRDFTAQEGESAANGVALWLPLMPRIKDGLTVRGAHYLMVVGCLKGNRTAAEAAADLNAISQRIAQGDSSRSRASTLLSWPSLPRSRQR